MGRADIYWDTLSSDEEWAGLRASNSPVNILVFALSQGADLTCFFGKNVIFQVKNLCDCDELTLLLMLR